VNEWQAPDLAQAALRGLCPRCSHPGLFGKGSLSGVISFAPVCGRCGLDFSRFNVGDGPAAFLIFIIGGLVMMLAIVLELSVHPPAWLHILLWVPLTIFLTLIFLRMSKAMLATLEHRNQAREGRLDP
jgi:uncharacterized protein (DUF983 family)